MAEDDEGLVSPAEEIDISDERQVRRRKLTQRQKEKKQAEDFKALLALPIGRDFVWRMLSNCRIYQHANYGEQGQRDLGRRDVGLELLKEILELAPEQYIIMQKEDRERSEGKRQ
jgi:hypothetical protein